MSFFSRLISFFKPAPSFETDPLTLDVIKLILPGVEITFDDIKGQTRQSSDPLFSDTKWRDHFQSVIRSEDFLNLLKALKSEGEGTADLQEIWWVIESTPQYATLRESLSREFIQSDRVTQIIHTYRRDNLPQTVLEAPLLYIPSHQEVKEAKGDLLELRSQILKTYLSTSKGLKAFSDLSVTSAQISPVFGGILETVGLLLSNQEGDSLSYVERARSAFFSLNRVSNAAPFNLFVRHLLSDLEQWLKDQFDVDIFDVQSAVSDPAVSELAVSDQEETVDHAEKTDEEINVHDLIPPVLKTKDSPLLSIDNSLSNLEPQLKEDSLKAIQLQSKDELKGESKSSTLEVSTPEASEVLELSTLEIVEKPQKPVTPSFVLPPFDEELALKWIHPITPLSQKREEETSTPSRPSRSRRHQYDPKPTAPDQKNVIYLKRKGQLSVWLQSTLYTTHWSATTPYPLPSADAQDLDICAWMMANGLPLQRKSLIQLLALFDLRLPEVWELRILKAKGFITDSHLIWTRNSKEYLWEPIKDQWQTPENHKMVTLIAFQAHSQDQAKIDAEATVFDAAEVLTQLAGDRLSLSSFGLEEYQTSSKMTPS